MTTDALVVVDVQNDFCERGTLPVSGGSGVAAAISEYLIEAADRYATCGHPDWHGSQGPLRHRQTSAMAALPGRKPGAHPHPGLDTSWIRRWFPGRGAAAYSGVRG